MRVTLYGKKVSVSKGISAEERTQREAQRNAAFEAERRARGIPAIGLSAAAREVAQASAEFQVGDAVMVGGQPAVVTGHFSLRAVSTKNGEYVDLDGDRLVYRPGYVCRDDGGDEYFWPAHKVKLPDGARSHLQLVREQVGERTKADYKVYSIKLLEVMGKVSARMIRPADIARYLRVERAAAPVRGNREVALLSNLMTVAVERGDIDVNPFKQVKRNLERRRTEAPDPASFAAFSEWLTAQGPQRHVIALMAEFAALVGSRRIEFLHLTLPQIDSIAGEIRLMRAKQHGGSVRVESIGITPKLEDLVRRLRALPRPDGCLHVFTTRDSNPYTDSGFASTWQRSMASALNDKVISRRFTFHDLRAYYTTQHKAHYGTLPELHADVKTTARVYDRSRVHRRLGLQ